MKTLVITRGCPGSGKSTFIKDNLPNATVCSADKFFSLSGSYKYDASMIGEAHKYCMREFLSSVATRQDLIVIDNTNIRVMDYIAYVRVAEALGYKAYQKVMSGNFQNVHGVPDSKVAKMKKDFQEDKFLEHLPDTFFKKD